VLKQRLITAALLIPIIVISIFFSPDYIFSLLIAFIICLGAWEWRKLIKLSHISHEIAYILLIISIMISTYLFKDTYLTLFIVAVGIIWWISALILIVLFQKESGLILNKLLKVGISLLVLIPAWSSLTVLHTSSNGKQLLIFLFVLIWVADSAAFFVGQLIGKRALVNKVSPGKSWEGVFGALFFSVLLGIGYAIITGRYHGSAGLVILCVVTVAFSIIGDLTESMLKRIEHLKDSGGLLPGHGGVLDRIDSMSSAAPVYLVGLWLLGDFTWQA
jgi:phosphatidate cytidylyltransferase